MKKGVHHLGFATLDLDRTVDFWTKKLGFKVAWSDIIEPPEGGKIRHTFMDAGDGTLVAFMCPEKVPGIPTEWATDINSAQGLPSGFYHFAFHCDDVPQLEAKRAELIENGVEVTAVVDHEWCRSIYFNDPNGLLLEFCATTRAFNEDDKVMKHRDQPGVMVKDPADAKKVMQMLMGRGKPKSKNVGV